MSLLLEIVEGPSSGLQLPLNGPTTLGRDESADITLPDQQLSRQHVRVTPQPDNTVVVEDLESTNGTFINHNQVYAPSIAAEDDEVLVGVTVLKVRSQQQVQHQPSAVIQRPPSLAAEERQPSYVRPVPNDLQGGGGGGGVQGNVPQGYGARGLRTEDTGVPELDRLVDARAKRSAQTAPLAVFVLVALAVVLYFGLAN